MPGAARSTMALATALAAVSVGILVLLASPRDRSLASPARSLRVALVLDVQGALGQINRPAVPGLRRAIKAFGVKGTVITATIKAGEGASFLDAGRQGYDLVIGLGFLAADTMESPARLLPHTRFAIVDTSVGQFRSRHANIEGFVFRDEEIGFMVGYLAALMEDRGSGRHVVSTIGGIAVPSVDRFIAGFRAGARKADPHVTLLNAYTNDFLDPAKCRRIALGQIARGSGVVFPVAGECSLGALDAVREHHVWGIGVDTDQSLLGAHILTSAVKRWDVAVFAAVQALVDGSYRGGTDRVLSLRDGGLGLGKVSPKVTPSILARVESVRRDIVSGRIRDIPTTVGGKS
jgi:basic membrane protein A